MSVFARRLKEARQRMGLSQEKLGVLAGIDEMSASARMNQYERGKHAPDWLTVERLATVLEVPVAYFYTADDEMAQVLIKLHGLKHEVRENALQYIRDLPSDS